MCVCVCIYIYIYIYMKCLHNHTKLINTHYFFYLSDTCMPIQLQLFCAEQKNIYLSRPSFFAKSNILVIGYMYLYMTEREKRACV